MRNYKRKTDKGQTSPEVMLRAIKEVKFNKKSIRSIARKYQVSHRTLSRYCLKFTKEQLTEDSVTSFKMGYSKKQVFSDEMELIFVDYLKSASDIFHGISIKKIRRLANEYAVYIKAVRPESWKTSEIAGPDWWGTFTKRHPGLIAVLNRDARNEVKCTRYYDNLNKHIEDNKLKPGKIWTLDETGIPSKQGNDDQKLQLVTMALAVSALGEFTKPCLFVPNEHILELYVNNGPSDCIVHVNPNGWMEEQHFYEFLKRLVKKTECSPNSKVLLLIENHEYYISLRMLEFIKSNGIILLTFPSFNNFQPLDRIIFGPFLKKFNSLHCLLAESKNKDVEGCDLACIVKDALESTLIPENIIAGFKECGIRSFDSLNTH
ncbi:uncharacterized protein LOC109594560 isoform X2 [Aethina tumida]|nr:uncharacterized protein LOC109594560 isoform X2 [Aethina tumida]